MNDLARVARISQIYAEAANANDYCRRLTHDPLVGKGLLGTQLLALSNRGTLHCVGSYGLEAVEPNETLNLFEASPIANAIRERRVLFEGFLSAGRSLMLWVLPLLRGEVPVGAVVSISDPEVEIQPFSEYEMMVVANTGAIYLDSLGLRNLFRETPQNGNGELTERQYEILLGMARGETNASIAQQLILSESSIKQESVRIFRSLGVSSRQQAVAKAKATGLLPPTVFADATA